MLRCLASRLIPSPQPKLLPRHLHTTASLPEKQLPPRPKINEDDLEENFLRGSGPGGQKINKTSCAVQLKHKPTGIVVKCQETRSRTQNRKYARKWLAEKLDVLEKGEESRTAIKAAVKAKKKASASKKSRRKYRKLEEEKNRVIGVGDDGDEDSENEDEGEEELDTVEAETKDEQKG